MKNSILIAIFFFFKEEIKLKIVQIQFIFNFIKEFSIIRFFCYLINNSIIPSRDKIFRNYILKNTNKWNFRMRSSKQNNDEYILITNMVNHLGSTMSEVIIGKNLMEMFKCPGVGLLRGYDLKSKIIFESFGIKKFIYLRNLNFFIRLKYFLQAYFIIKSCKSIENFFEFNLNDVNMGQAVYDHYLRFTGIGTIDHIDYKLYFFLSQAISNYYQMKKNYDKFKFIISVQTERQFIPGSIIYQSSLTRGVDVYSRSGISNAFSVRKYSNTKEMWKTRERYSKKLYDEISNRIKEKAVDIGGVNIEKRFKGIPEYDAFHEFFERPNFKKLKKKLKYEKKNVAKKELCENLGWDQNIPIVVILASDLTDGVFDNTWTLFKDRLSWSRETFFKIRSIKTINWLVKPHPNDENHQVLTDTISEYKKICSDCKHILPFPNDISIASIPKFVHAVVTIAGSASYEYPCFGIPVIQTCESVCSGRGFTIDPSSKEEYFDILNKIGQINKLKDEQIEKAKIHVFIYTVLAKINVNLITPFEIHKMNDKNFWSRMIKLVDNYKEEEDSLKEMMKIQEKNNDRHTINYNLLK